jgi:hypothetical protein
MLRLRVFFAAALSARALNVIDLAGLTASRKYQVMTSPRVSAA